MTESDDFSIDCTTCIGTGTTACNDCFVTHLLANDDGPINYVPVSFTPVSLAPVPDPQELAVSLLVRAGLVDEPVQRIPLEEFEAYGVPVHA